MSTDWTDADEYPLATLPDTPLWCENYAFSCFDVQRDIAMIALLGRWPALTEIWRELLLISLGDERVICVRQHGRAATARVAAGALFRVEVLRPGQALRLSYDGPASAHHRDELLSLGLQNRPLQRLRLQVDFEARAPVWNMSGHAARGEAIAGALHLEQVGSGTGFIEFDGERHVIEQAFMNRDHSRGFSYCS